MPTAAEALLTTDSSDLRAKIATRDAMIAGLDARVNRLNKLLVQHERERDEADATITALRDALDLALQGQRALPY